MTDEPDDLGARILALLDDLGRRVERLERGREEASELALRVAEMDADHLLRNQARHLHDKSVEECLHAMARELGGQLVMTPIERRTPRRRPRLIIDNTTKPEGEP